MTNQNLKFLVCCANGSGSSLMAQMALEKVLKKNNIKPQGTSLSALRRKEQCSSVRCTCVCTEFCKYV